MYNIIEEKINRVLTGKELQWSFSIKKDGLYAIEIMASCKNWRQNLSVQDDDLAIKIDSISFPHKKDSKKLFDGEAAWNGGEKLVPKEGKFQEEKYFSETKNFIRDVLDYQNKCKSKQKQGGKISLAFALAVLDIVLIWHCVFLTLPYFLVKPLPESSKMRTILSEQLIDVDGDGVKERLQAVCYKPECGLSADMSQILIVKSEYNFIEVPGHGAGFLWFKIGDFNQNGKLELLVDYDNYGNAGFETWFLYEWQDDHFELLLKKTEVLFNLEVKDTDNDGLSEIIQTFWPYKEPKVKQIFKWDKQTKEYFLQKTIETHEF